jgi:hypothetical protein
MHRQCQFQTDRKSRKISDLQRKAGPASESRPGKIYTMNKSKCFFPSVPRSIPEKGSLTTVVTCVDYRSIKACLIERDA